jgi:hypothetical protein
MRSRLHLSGPKDSVAYEQHHRRYLEWQYTWLAYIKKRLRAHSKRRNRVSSSLLHSLCAITHSLLPYPLSYWLHQIRTPDFVAFSQRSMDVGLEGENTKTSQTRAFVT